MNTDPFFYFISERESIRQRRAAGLPPPWTNDEILAKHRFTNVRREQDAVTIWIRKNIREPFADHPLLWWMCCAARQFNLPESLEELISAGAWPNNLSFQPAQMTEVLEGRRARKARWHTGVYILPPPSRRSEWGTWTKARYLSEVVLGRLWEDRELLTPRIGSTLKTTYDVIIPYRGWGDFLIFQAITDMAHCENLLAHASDRNTWAVAGPGTRRGLNRIFERPVNLIIPKTQILFELRLLRRITERKLGDNAIELADVCSCLCEVDKLCRLREGTGRVRNKFDQKKAFDRDQAERERVNAHTPSS